MKPAGHLGARVSAERRLTRARDACELIRERWRLPMKDHPTHALLAEAGISRATAVKHLGDRKQVIRDWAVRQAVATSNRRRKRNDDAKD